MNTDPPVSGVSAQIAAFAAVAPLHSTSGSPARGAAGPNVIVVFLDTVRYDAVFDTDGRVTSALPSLARLRTVSTAFTRAYGTSSWTLPSHLSAVTGLPAHQLGVGFGSQVYTRPDPTLAERFQRRGYRTAAVISNSFMNAGSGFARDSTRSSRHTRHSTSAVPGRGSSRTGTGRGSQPPSATGRRARSHGARAR